MDNNECEIASRVFEWGGKPIAVSLFAPVKVSETEWHCTFKIDGLPVGRMAISVGIDSFQALMNAIEAIRQEVSKPELGLTWQFGFDNDLGLHRSIPNALGTGFYQRMCDILDKEIEIEVARSKSLRLSKI